MKNILIIFLLFLLLTFAGYILTSQNNEVADSTSEVSDTGKQISDDDFVSSAEQVADKLEIYYFHRTQRCYSCLTIGKYVNEIIEDSFANEIQDGTIDFQEINVELPENREIVKRFQASGSSLFINAIRNSQDDISQDENVWKLAGDEKQFKSYLKNKLNSLLGK